MTDPRIEAAAHAIAAYYDAQANEHHDRYTESDLGAATAALAAADKAATITTVEELASLPEGSLGIDSDGHSFYVGYYGPCVVDYDPCVAPSPSLPARVLHYGDPR